VPSILFINRVYPPESGATGRVLEYVARGFVSAGWDVSVLTTAGDHSKEGSSVQGGVKVIRIAMPFSKKSLLTLALGYALMIPSLLLKALMLPRADVVVTKTDPPMLLILGPFLKYLKGVRTIHWAQDLYPEVAEEVGVFPKGGVVAGVLRSISTRSMMVCDVVVAVGRCMAERLEGRGIAQEKIRVLPNTGVEDDIVPVARENNEFRKRHGLEGAFVIEYSGNLGRAHDFGTVLEAARLLEQRGETGILFLFVGSGPGEGLLRDEVVRMGLRNIRFLPPQPAEFLSQSLGAGDLHLVTMKSGMSGLVVPSKFYGVMAAGRPCLFVGPEESEVARVILEHGVGEVVAPGDADALVRAILRYRAAPQLTEDERFKASVVLRAGDASVGLIRIATEVVTRTPNLSRTI
jgi:glycosyltransferase involved in cell wall biosynthesis